MRGACSGCPSSVVTLKNGIELEDGPARFLRIVKAVSQPDDDLLDIDNTAFGVSQANGMREIVGYTMIEPDGSVMVKVPANTALQVSVLDEDGKRITPRHRNWISLVPGQELKCNGCHVQNSGLSHGRPTPADHRRCRSIAG